jgi:hypothetical protein
MVIMLSSSSTALQANDSIESAGDILQFALPFDPIESTKCNNNDRPVTFEKAIARDKIIHRHTCL